MPLQYCSFIFLRRLIKRSQGVVGSICFNAEGHNDGMYPALASHKAHLVNCRAVVTLLSTDTVQAEVQV